MQRSALVGLLTPPGPEDLIVFPRYSIAGKSLTLESLALIRWPDDDLLH